MGLVATEIIGLRSANRELDDYYRLPSGGVQLVTKGRSQSPLEFPGRRHDALLRGRYSWGDTVKSSLQGMLEALECAQFGPGRIELAFDVEEVIQNLRRERYAARFRQEGLLFNEILRKTYYCVRPLLGVLVRRGPQKWFLRGWDKIKFPAWPIDCTVDRIHQKLLALSLRVQGVDKLPFIWFWPEGHSSCAIMTHDVEGKAGRNFCARLMDLDESFAIPSSFQVVPEGRYPVSKEFLDSIRSRGFEVNVHDLRHDGRLYADRGEFIRRAKRINRYIQEFGAQGFRSGSLYRNADWFDAFEFSYDMSLPNVAHLDPQRGGCCTVMPFFIGGIVELPLTCTQDYSLFQILDDYSTDLWEQQIGLVRERHGLISFIVHPDYIIEPRAQSIYKALLAHLTRLRAEDGIWFALPKEVATWWRQRSEMELVRKNGDWSVEGPGKERARVAYASLSGDTVNYSFDAE